MSVRIMMRDNTAAAYVALSKWSLRHAELVRRNLDTRHLSQRISVYTAEDLLLGYEELRGDVTTFLLIQKSTNAPVNNGHRLIDPERFTWAFDPIPKRLHEVLREWETGKLSDSQVHKRFRAPNLRTKMVAEIRISATRCGIGAENV